MRLPSRRRRLAVGLAALCLPTLLAACNDGGASPAPSSAAAPARPDESGDWTVFVYQAADNNLEGDSLLDLVEMTRATGTTFVVLVDRSADYSDEDVLGLGDFEDSRLLHIRDGEVEVLASPGELNMGDAATLAGFLGDGLARYRNDHHALVVWDHGGAWSGAAWDDEADDHLELAEIAAGVQDGLARAGVGTLDLMGFDACLMATYETATALQPYARYLLASEELEPGHGWDWAAASTPPGGSTTVELATSIVDGYKAQSEASGQDDAITLSLLDLSGLAEVDAAVGELASRLDASAAGLVGRVGAGRAQALGFGRDPDPSVDAQMVDLGDLGDELALVPELGEQASQLRSAVSAMTVYATSSSSMSQATGLSAYFPPVASLGKADYDRTPVATAWLDFLRAYYTKAEGVAADELPSFLDDDRYLEDAEVDYGSEGLGLHAAVAPGTGANIARARLYWGEVDTDPGSSQVVFYGERNAVVVDDEVSGSYDWRMLRIGDGDVTAVVYSMLEVDERGEVGRVIVPGLFHHDEETSNATLVLTVAEGDIVAARFNVTSGQATAQVTPMPGDTFTPRLLLQDLDDFSSEWVPSPAGALRADTSALRYGYDRVPAGTAVFAELGITAIDGSSDYVFHGTASPS